VNAVSYWHELGPQKRVTRGHRGPQEPKPNEDETTRALVHLLREVAAVTPRAQLLVILQDPERVAEVQPGDVPTLLGELEFVRVQLWTRLVSAAVTHVDETQSADHLLTLPQAAAALGVSIRWLHRHHRQLPFTRRLSRRVLRFSELGLRRWVEQQPNKRV
jgi:predicted DNA-binding transcriptional regulator AlpA